MAPEPRSPDVAVVLPGIMGSTLARHGRPVWAPSPGALLRGVATFGGSVRELTLPDGIGDAHPDDGVTATGLMTDVHALPGIWTPVRGYDRLLERLRGIGHTEAEGNLVPFPYDWRLSNRHTAGLLARAAEDALRRRREHHPDARLVLVGHSMGGLIAQHYLARADPDLVRAVITLGSPRRGAASAVAQLVNGVRPGLGRLAVDLTAFARSLPSLHQLLPSYACLDNGHSPLTTVDETPLPVLDRARVADAAAFHGELVGDDDRVHRIVGDRQPTPTTVRIAGEGAELLDTYRDRTGAPEHDFGDATVPAAGALPPGLALDTSHAQRFPDRHGNLQRNHAVLDTVVSVLGARPRVRREPGHSTVPRVGLSDLVLHGEPVEVRVGVDGEAHRIRVAVADERGRLVAARTPTLRDGGVHTTLDGLEPGAYSVVVDGGAPSSAVAAVTATVVVWPTAAR